MDGAAGEKSDTALRVTFDSRLKLELHGSKVTSDAGLLPFRDLDDALGLTELAGEVLADTRTGQNSRHTLMAQLRQSVFGRLAGYEDVNDAERLAHDPALRWVVGGRAVTQKAASTSQMGRFETEVLTQDVNLSALADLPGRWIDRVHARRPVRGIVLDMDSTRFAFAHASATMKACAWAATIASISSGRCCGRTRRAPSRTRRGDPAAWAACVRWSSALRATTKTSWCRSSRSLRT